MILSDEPSCEPVDAHFDAISEPHPDEFIDRTYRLHQQLGAGGMGAVFRATHVVSGKKVALKLVAGADAGQKLRLALAREFQTLASLHHPNIVEVINYGFDEVRGPYIAMELLPSPQTVLEAGRGQPVAGKIGLIAQLLRALSFVHRRGILHRDLCSPFFVEKSDSWSTWGRDVAWSSGSHGSCTPISPRRRCARDAGHRKARSRTAAQ